MNRPPDALPVDAVTGAFSYSGAAVARELIRRGREVRTLTGHAGRAAAKSQPITDVRPLQWEDLDSLRESLDGVDTLFNTYWVRFEHDTTTFARAVENSSRLFQAAAEAGVRRIVHISITHADPESPYPYFRGKADVENSLKSSGVSYAIVRPAILFGGDDVLVNNIAWLLRHLPVFAVGGRGRYKVRGIHVDDLATLCADLAEPADNRTVDAVGPESLEFIRLVRVVRRAVGSKALIVSVPAPVLVRMGSVLGMLLHDKLLTADEYRAMADGLADSDATASGSTAMSEWIAAHGDELGRHYANELTRHYA